MFDIGFQELIMIAVVALVVVGPKRLPELAKTAGRVFADLKRSFDGVKARVTAEMKEVEKEAKDDGLISRPDEVTSANQDIAENTGLAAGNKEL